MISGSDRLSGVWGSLSRRHALSLSSADERPWLEPRQRECSVGLQSYGPLGDGGGDKGDKESQTAKKVDGDGIIVSDRVTGLLSSRIPSLETLEIAGSKKDWGQGQGKEARSAPKRAPVFV